MRGLFILFALVAVACSFTLDKGTVQCTTSADCEQFDDHPICSADKVCIASGLGPHGCFFGTPATSDQFATACSTAQCLPFDNCARLGFCDPNAALPALVPKP